MMKLVFVFCVAITCMQQAEAFKIITIHKGVLPLSAAAPAAPAVDPAALFQGVQSAVAGKLQLVQSLIGALIQQKTALKQNALNSIQGTLGSLKSNIGSLSGSLHPKFLIHKQIYFGGLPRQAPVAPDSTTSVEIDVDATTTEK